MIAKIASWHTPLQSPWTNLMAWEAEVSLDSHNGRPAIRYTILTRCPICKLEHKQTSPLWSLLARINSRHSVHEADWAQRKIEEELSVGRRIYFVTINGHEGKKVIEWMTRENVGHETKSFVTGTWSCSRCGSHFGLTAEDQAKMLQEVCATITIEWVDDQIVRLNLWQAKGPRHLAQKY